MKTLYVAGAFPDRSQRYPFYPPWEYPKFAMETYQRIDDWCRERRIRALLPRDSRQWQDMKSAEFAKKVRTLIDESTHVLIALVNDSAAVGVEAGYASQGEKHVAVWYPRWMEPSRILDSISTVAPGKLEEPIEAALNRLLE